MMVKEFGLGSGIAMLAFVIAAPERTMVHQVLVEPSVADAAGIGPADTPTVYTKAKNTGYGKAVNLS
jgi:hypothetical protein